MNPLSSLCLVACLLAVACASPSSHQNARRNSNSINNSLKPTEWLSPSSLESLPAINEVTLQQLESMPVDNGADLVRKLYHLSQLSEEVVPNYVPNSNEVTGYIVGRNGQKVQFNLNQLPAVAEHQTNFGNEEVTIFITGLPQSIDSVKKATQKLENAYKQRYNIQQRRQQQGYSAHQNPTSSEENYNQNQRNSNSNSNSNSYSNSNSNSGDLVVIRIGDQLNNFQRIATINVEKTGNILGDILTQVTEKAQVPQERINIVAQGVTCHIAGAAARQYTRNTGNQVRRITCLDPSKIFAKNENVVTGLARGDADFVDAIHTSAYGLGTTARVGDVDFYPNGPSTGVPGAENVIEASMRATRYFAESVRPGNERAFPAVAANSLQQYKNNNGSGKRTYMGVATDFDLEGDYILQVNAQSPFGKNAPAQRQSPYHSDHSISQDWNNGMNSADYS